MNNLIKNNEIDFVKVFDYEINSKVQKCYNGRELWYALESKQEFANWI